MLLTMISMHGEQSAVVRHRLNNACSNLGTYKLRLRVLQTGISKMLASVIACTYFDTLINGRIALLCLHGFTDSYIGMRFHGLTDLPRVTPLST